MSSIKLVLRQDKVNKKSGKAPLYLRIIKDRRTRFISMGLQFEPQFWDEDKQKVKKAYPNSARMNASLAQKISEAEQTVLEEGQKNKNISTKNLKISLLGKEPAKFFEFVYKRLEMVRVSKKVSTHMNYLKFIRKFKRFVGKEDIYFEDITVSLLKDYEQSLIKEKNSPVTVAYSLRVLGTFFNMAINEELIPLAMNPFKKIKIKVTFKKRDYLNEEQYKAFLEYKPDHPTTQTVYDMFLFATYAGGLRFIDVLTLQWKHYNFNEKRISKVIRKTDTPHQFRLPEQACEILKKYSHNSTEPEDYIFPLLKEESFQANSELSLYLRIRSLSNRANVHLAKINTTLNLPYKLTFHIARHTFATRALSKGMRIEYVSKILGHTTIKQTQIYAKIINSDLDRAMDEVFAR